MISISIVLQLVIPSNYDTFDVIDLSLKVPVMWLLLSLGLFHLTLRKNTMRLLSIHFIRLPMTFTSALESLKSKPVQFGVCIVFSKLDALF